MNDICGPIGTVTASGGGQSVSAAVMIQANGGFNTTHAKAMHEPMTTVTNTGSQQQLAAANLVHLRGNCDARDVNDPLHTISAGGQHHGLASAFMERAFGGSIGQSLEEPAPTITAGGGGKSSLVSLTLSPEHEAGALRVAAFLISYYGTENISACDSPAPTITTKDRLAMVTVMVKGTPYVIVDIRLRMLKPSELYKAQGFPPDYIISQGTDGKPFTKTQQVHMCGNRVSPPPMVALARANDPWRVAERQAEAAWSHPSSFSEQIIARIREISSSTSIRVCMCAAPFRLGATDSDITTNSVVYLQLVAALPTKIPDHQPGMARQGLPVKRIYLSGAMSGLPGLNIAAFHAMTICMRAGSP